MLFSHHTHKSPIEQHIAPSIVNDEEEEEDDDDDDDEDDPCLTFASAAGVSVVPTRAFGNAPAIVQYCLLSTRKTFGTIGATTLTGLVTS